MKIGPIFARALQTAPRAGRLHRLLAVYVGALLLVATTAWQLLAGSEVLRGVGALAQFGAAVFAILAPVHWLLVTSAAVVVSVLSVGQEKDRHTLDLLLMTHLTSGQLVVGKLLSSLAVVSQLWLVAWPVLGLLSLLGGVGHDQIARFQMVTLVHLFAAGCVGTMLGFWREQTYQSLSLAVIALTLLTLAGELLRGGWLSTLESTFDAPAYFWERCAVVVSPWHAVNQAARPHWAMLPGATPWSLAGPVPVALIVGVALLGWTTRRARAWCLSERSTAVCVADGSARPGFWLPRSRQRVMWRNPILWREVRTWAYGRRVLLVRFGYGVLLAATVAVIVALTAEARQPARLDLATALVPIAALSLLIVNAAAVTSITSERDAPALDLLLVTDLTSGELLLGKLLGVAFNAKEMICGPVLLVAWLVLQGTVRLATGWYLAAGWLVLCSFSAVLGVHTGLHYARSRTAISVSLGALVYLLLGVATAMRVMLAFAGSFGVQLQPFLAAIVGGGVGLYVALGARSPSTAILLASCYCPLATFYALTSFLLGHTLAVFLAIVAAYGFNVAAMLVPSLYELPRAESDEPRWSE